MTTATDTLRAIIGAQEAAKRAERDTYEAAKAAREAQYAAEAAHRDAERDAQAATLAVHDLARAITHAGEPVTVTESDSWSGARTEYGATFGRATCGTESTAKGYTSKPGPRRAIAYGHSARDGSTDLYRSERGTSDPDKLDAELRKAHAAARAWAEERTADAWLIRHGLDDLTDPTAAARQLDRLAAVTLELRANWYGDRSYLSPRWSVTLGGVPVGQPLDTWELWPENDERDAITKDEPTPPEARTPEAWRAYQEAMEAHYNRPDTRARALRAAGLVAA